ncbi:hypothetical protein LWI28_018758 [Acer negundo]|uniref:Uncharacterized protein n=1 Tax=Acer negundo TaxID=4023 RepID=A0AAD5J699_ACENE|nr:hypothetical protein LWI28_018758 [Acer negundo]KAK4849836.1 hypothetical protein QYF36_001274 [Acer negundo]
MTTSWAQPDPIPDSGPEWPVDPVPSPQPTTTGWPEFKPKAPKEPVSEQDPAILSAFQLQNKVVECCREFFSKRGNDDEESDESDEDDEEYEELVEEEESEEYRFLLDLFVNDDKLRDHYEINHENGGFCCLVCRGIGENLSKRYKDCLGLVQHAIAVSKTKRRRTHRAFGMVVCKVLGWDFDRLPVIVLKGDPLGKSLPNSSMAQGEEAKGNADNDKEDTTVVKHNEGFMTENNSEIKIVEKEVSSVSQKDGEVKVCEDSLKVDDARKCIENLDAEVLNIEAYKEVAVECQESNTSLVASNSWSCIEPVDELSPIASGWPTLKPKKPLVIQFASAEDKVKLAAVELQHKVSKACREFFDENAGSEGDEEDEDNLMDEDESEDSEDFKFFLKVFSENCELRNYYEKNYEAGEFCCLVCGGIGKKVWKRFKDCLGLLQHSTAISNTKKKRAHRAFGQVVCKVLGWDVDRLPMIVSKGEPLGQSLAKSGVLQGEAEMNAEENKDEITASKNNADCELDQKENSCIDQKFFN